MRLCSAVALSLTLFATPALAQSNCFRIDDLRDWRMADAKTLLVEDSYRRVFRLGLLGVCDYLAKRESLAFRSIGGSRASCLETGDQVLTRSFPSGVERCTVTKIEPYPSDTMKADGQPPMK